MSQFPQYCLACDDEDATFFYLFQLREDNSNIYAVKTNVPMAEVLGKEDQNNNY